MAGIKFLRKVGSKSDIYHIIWLPWEYDLGRVYYSGECYHYKEDPCTICEGSGKKTWRCSLCNGKGKILLFFTCPECKGTGKIVKEEECSHCYGEGKIHLKAHHFKRYEPYRLIKSGQNT